METSVLPPGITPRQQLLIDALATGVTITKAAEHVGIARKTAYNWLEIEEFQAALADRRKELAERVAERVAELGQASGEHVAGLPGDREQPNLRARQGEAGRTAVRSNGVAERREIRRPLMVE